jgi:hypothetical protein
MPGATVARTAVLSPANNPATTSTSPSPSMASCPGRGASAGCRRRPGSPGRTRCPRPRYATAAGVVKGPAGTTQMSTATERPRDGRSARLGVSVRSAGEFDGGSSDMASPSEGRVVASGLRRLGQSHPSCPQTHRTNWTNSLRPDLDRSALVDGLPPLRGCSNGSTWSVPGGFAHTTVRGRRPRPVAAGRRRRPSPSWAASKSLASHRPLRRSPAMLGVGWSNSEGTSGIGVSWARGSRHLVCGWSVEGSLLGANTSSRGHE